LTSPEDRRKALGILDAGMAASARAFKLAELLGVGLTTLQRWKRQFAGDGDGLDRRKGSPRLVSHRLTQEERQRILLPATSRNSPPCRLGKSFLSWPIGASTSARSAASTGCSMTMVRPIAAGGLALHRSRVPFRA